ncbi:LacI family DNA-binding transcriptional regulator [Jannaschia seohaensis]|uniref:DNA-binding LacI/PurR family transcriptional regulator n=1 Tax=Jannaschia seohaensis TaxID=475081 RepID=A0A2Y9AAT0_9RHOB|nr:LacI family DNA-binding transcriptional regulator [Jannaschia seohaensis]PWJ20865.1 DNA-binding LacI/PurR family transcriptional regulator [Jannaschia seohaensis]SSA41275.1 DNA-binding transcriptional regulator, LacI/PurR family [Jannaschia seohaensis]
MSGKKVTSLDVARAAGVSQSAVSRVFTKGASVSEAMEKRVREAAERLGYRPNVLARSLITGRSRIVGLVVAYLDNPFFADAVEKLSHALQAEGYHLLIFTVGNSGADLDGVVSELMDYQVDALIAASVDLSGALVARCASAGLPVVLFNRGIDKSGMSAVTSDNRAGGRRVAEFLLAGGHERIAHISGWQGSSTGRDRREGFEAGLRAAGAAPLEVIDGRYSRAEAAEAARAMMDRPDPPDAIFVGNDYMALAVMDVLRFDLGLSVPGDVSVVGFDDIAMSAWPAYDLTTLRQPVRRMIAATVEEVLARIDTPSRRPSRIEIEGPLVVRGSARLPRSGSGGESE